MCCQQGAINLYTYSLNDPEFFEKLGELLRELLRDHAEYVAKMGRTTWLAAAQKEMHRVLNEKQVKRFKEGRI